MKVKVRSGKSSRRWILVSRHSILAKSWTAKSLCLEPRMGRKAYGYAWASQAGAVLSNPFASELAEDSEIPSPILLRKWPYDASSEIFRRKCGVALGFQAGTCCEKASASPLARVFSTTNPAFAQRINPCFLSLFDSFAPTHLALRANLLLLYRAPAPGAWLWFKKSIRCTNDPVSQEPYFFSVI